MSSFPIPDAALDDRLGILGTSGSGKTYSALGAVERLLNRHGRVVIVDPMGVCYGLRSLADGKTPSPYKIPIFGGVHKDLPLPEHAGALIGETAATMAESCIIDLSELATKSAERRFMTAFLDAIFRAAKSVREPFHLVIDEADLFAPQKPPAGDETLLGLMEQICRRGRVLGFIPWLISQRPAVLNKNVLSMMDGLVAFRMTSPQDRNALDDWIEGQADREQGRQIKGTLPAKQTGHAVIWIPTRHILTEDALFPVRQTFDSSRAPKRGEKRISADLKPIDLAVLEKRLSTIKAEADANDPAKLKAQIAALQKELKKPAFIDPAEIQRQRQEAYLSGEQAALDKLQNFHSRTDSLTADIAAYMRVLENHGGVVVDRQITYQPLTPGKMRPFPVDAKVREYKFPLPAIRKEAGEKMGRAERTILTAIVQFPHSTPDKIGIIAGYSSSSGHFNNILGSLRSKSWIEHGQPLRPSSAGIEALGNYEPLPTGRALIDYWCGKLGRAERAIFEAIVNRYPEAIHRAALGQVSGYSETSGHFNNCLGKLRTLELVSRGQEVRASDALFA